MSLSKYRQKGKPDLKKITTEQAIYFRNEFRKARLATERDPQDCMSIAHVLESFGTQICESHEKRLRSLEKFSKDINTFIDKHHPMDANCLSDYHIGFSRLYNVAKFGRNDMAHRGSRARFLAPRFLELSIAMEDALMAAANTEKAGDYMVRGVTTAQLCQPLSAIRQDMLINSFTSVPYFHTGEWFVVEDLDIARYLRPNGKYEPDRLNDTLECAIKKDTKFAKHQPLVHKPDSPITDISTDLWQQHKHHLPVLIRHPNDKQHLLGILTSSDLM